MLQPGDVSWSMHHQMVVPKLLGVNEDASDMLVSVRCVIAAATDGEISFTVPAIADRTGLTVDQVRHILASPKYHELMNQEVRQLVAHTLVRGVNVLDRIVNNGEAKNADKIAAHRAIVQTYQALNGQQGPPPSDAATDFDKLMANLKKTRIKVEEQNGSEGRTPADPEAEQERRQGIADPDA